MELIVVIGLVGLMLTIAAPAANSKAMSLPQAAEELQSNFRLARANSMRHGAHFRVTITGGRRTLFSECKMPTAMESGR